MDVFKTMMKLGMSKVDALQATLMNKFVHRPLENQTYTLHWACSRGRLDMVQNLLSNGADPTRKDPDSKTSLHLAVENIHYDVMMELLKKWSEALINEQDKDGKTAVHFAAESGNINILVALIESGAHLAIQNITFMTPLHVGARKNHFTFVKTITEAYKFNLEACEISGRTPLMFAAINGSREMILHLLSLGADPNCRDHQGFTPLIAAAMNGHTKALRALFDFQVDISDCDLALNTALHLACANGHPDTVKYLLESGADPVARNAMNKIPLECAVENSLSETAISVLKDKSWKTTMRARTMKGLTPMNLLIEKTPEAAKVVLDQCVLRSDHNKNDPKYEIVFDYEFLDPGPYDPASKHRRYFAPTTMACHNRECLLSHVLTQSLLARKWRSCVGLYMFNILAYLVHIGALTVYVNTGGLPRDLNATTNLTHTNYTLKLAENIMPRFERTSVRQSIQTSEFRDRVLIHPATVAAHITKEDMIKSLANGDDNATVFLVVVYGIVYFSIKELVSFCQEGCRYLFRLEAIRYWLMIIATTGYLLKDFLPSFMDRRAGYITCIITYVNFLLYLKRMDKAGLYVLMFEEVFKSVLKISFLLIMFAELFSLVFQLTLGNAIGYTGAPTIITVLAMAFGELGYRETFLLAEKSTFYTIDVYIIFFCFLLVVPVTLINLMIGIAVGDIGNVMKAAYLNRLKLQIDHVYKMSVSYPKCLQKRFHNKYFRYLPNDPKSKARKYFRQAMGIHNEVLLIGDKEKDTIATRVTALHDKVDTCMKTLHSVMASQTEILTVLKEKVGVVNGETEDIPEPNKVCNDITSILSDIDEAELATVNDLDLKY